MPATPDGNVGSKRIMEFTVDSINEEGLILGKNGSEDIPLGTIFTKITKIKVDGSIQDLKTIELGEIASINLTLQKVSFYSSEVDAVPGGHTAGLHLEGEGITLLENVLGMMSEGEYVHIQA